MRHGYENDPCAVCGERGETKPDGVCVWCEGGAADAYRRLESDDERRGFLAGAIETGLSDGVFAGLMLEILGPDWPDELVRLGLAEPQP